MTDTTANDTETLREETAGAAPEVAEHDAADARIADLERQLAEARQAVLYAQAETQNVRRRADDETAKARDYAVTAFARDILSVSDNLQRGLQAIPAELRDEERFKGLVTGLDATGRELDSVLGRHGIQKIEAMGQPLDPNKHQAVVEIPSPDAEPGTVVQEMQTGYTIKGRLLRAAMVGVAAKG